MDSPPLRHPRHVNAARRKALAKKKKKVAKKRKSRRRGGFVGEDYDEDDDEEYSAADGDDEESEDDDDGDEEFDPEDARADLASLVSSGRVHRMSVLNCFVANHYQQDRIELSWNEDDNEVYRADNDDEGEAHADVTSPVSVRRVPLILCFLYD